MNFFENVKTLEELRKEYRRLAMIYHPDKGGSTLFMQMLNDQYERFSKRLINANPDFNDGRKEYEQQVSEDIRDMLDHIIFLKGVEIEIIGSWIWITGNTFPVRTTLKNSGFNFSHQKCAWYWHKGEYRKKNGTLKSLDEVRDFWGSTKVSTKAESNHIE